MNDIEIAQSIALKPIAQIAEKLNIPEELLEYYGRYKSKLPLSLIDFDKIEKSNLVLVTAMTPTPAGEGKTTTAAALGLRAAEMGRDRTVIAPDFFES